MSQTTRGEQQEAPKERWLRIIRQAAEAFVEAQPLSVPVERQKQAMDRTIAAFRAAAAKDTKGQFYVATPESLGRAIALCALTGLMPGGPVPEVDLIPRTKWVKVGDEWKEGPVEITWQIGWRGYVTLAARAGCHVRSVPVFRPDQWTWEEGLDRKLVHVPNPDHQDHGEWDALRFCYVVAKYRDGFMDFEVLTRKGIEDRRASSESWRNYIDVTSKKGSKQWEIDRAATTPWVQWPIDMARKTAIRYAASRGLFAFDEAGVFGMELDRKADVIDASEVDHRTNGRGSLPDYDPLGQGDHEEPQREPVPTRGVAAVAAAVSSPPPAEPQGPPADKHNNGVDSRSRSEPEAGSAAGGGDQQQEGELVHPPDPKRKTPPPNSIAEAQIIHWWFQRQAVPCSFELAKRALREGLGALKLGDERVMSALFQGRNEGFWVLDGDPQNPDTVKLVKVQARADHQPAGPTLAPVEDPEITKLSTDDLVDEIADEELFLREHPTLAAGMPQILNKLADESGLATTTAGPVLDGAPTEALRRYLVALRKLRGSRP